VDLADVHLGELASHDDSHRGIIADRGKVTARAALKSGWVNGFVVCVAIASLYCERMGLEPILAKT
jgi:hypothetical protein